MNKKTFYGLILTIALIFFGITYTFAANNIGDGLKDAANGVRNVVGGAENAVEDAARDISNTSKDATRDLEKEGNKVTGNTNNNRNDNARNSTYMGASSSNNGISGTTDYTASRTATDASADILGIDSTAWIWMILAVVSIAIIALIYSYVKQQNNVNYEYDNSEE